MKPGLPESELNKTIEKIKAGNTKSYRQVKEIYWLNEDQERILQSLIQIQQ
jgi:Zn-finger nucleic acid-binding protein